MAAAPASLPSVIALAASPGWVRPDRAVGTDFQVDEHGKVGNRETRWNDNDDSDDDNNNNNNDDCHKRENAANIGAIGAIETSKFPLTRPSRRLSAENTAMVYKTKQASKQAVYRARTYEVHTYPHRDRRGLGTRHAGKNRAEQDKTG
ncbi:hypothetical protein B0J11DRAFT_578077 [Dendryphion nanum]|uniref:Uncharacterized protein n=1 Tax=Dendryphion nanum TaxID=256645 RepID=A0A9P9IPT3_9PLEO|nr:hypothetical protein B0J11DRAFT_578077 [Dendryphion nanum]